MTPEQIVDRIKEGNAKKIATETGIPYDRIAKWVQGKSKPKFADCAVLEEYFENGKNSTKKIVALGKKIPSRLTAEEHAEAFPNWEGVPVYNKQISASFIEQYQDVDNDWQPTYYLKDPDFRNCNFAARIAGDSMHSEIRHGDYVVCQEIIDTRFIVYGDIYYVVASNGLETCKYVNAYEVYSNDPKDTRRRFDDTKVLLVPKNDSISPTPLPKDMILKLYKVKGIIRSY